MPTEEELKTLEASAAQPPDKAQVQGQQDVLEDFDKERAMSTIKAQREAEQKLAKELKDAKAALKAFQDEEQKRKDAELSELEKAQKRAAELEKSLKDAQTLAQTFRLQQSFRTVTAKLSLKFASDQAEEDAFELADLSDVEIDADGKVKGLEEAIKGLHKSRPYLFAAEDTEPPGTPKRPKLPGNTGQRNVSAPKINF